MLDAPLAQPLDVGLRRVRRRRIRRHAPAVAGFGEAQHALPFRLLQEIEQAPAIIRHEGIEIDQLCDAVAGAVGDAGRDHAAIAVAEQHDVAQILDT